MERFKRQVVIMLLTCGFGVLSITSCARSLRLIPIPPEHRLKGLILPLKDLTGSYAPVEPKLEELIKDASKTNFIRYTYRGPSSSYDVDVYRTNHYIMSNVGPDGSDLANYYARKDNLSSTNIDSSYDFVVLGSVQQLQYGSPVEISKYIVNAWLWGAWGLLLSDRSTKENRAALIECNFKIYDARKRNQIASFTIQGAEKLPINDREKIVRLANKKIAEGFLFKLDNEVSKVYKIKAKEYYRSGNKYYQWK